MSLPKVKISDVMTAQIHTIRAGEVAATAQEMMTRYGIRHLPVLDGGKLVGILSERDFTLATGIRGTNLKTLPVEELCSQQVYITHPNSLLKDVAFEMAEKRYGSTVVTEGNQVVGILTTTDICRVLAQILAGDMAEFVR